MTSRPTTRHAPLHIWSSLLALLVGVLASASACALGGSISGGISAGEQASTARLAGPAPAMRSTTADPWLSAGGSPDDGWAIPCRLLAFEAWAGRPSDVLPTSIAPPREIARIRDGRTRAPPLA